MREGKGESNPLVLGLCWGPILGQCCRGLDPSLCWSLDLVDAGPVGRVCRARKGQGPTLGEAIKNQGSSSQIGSGKTRQVGAQRAAPEGRGRPLPHGAVRP